MIGLGGIIKRLSCSEELMEQGSPLCARHELKKIPVWALKTVKLIYLQIVVLITTFLGFGCNKSHL